MNNPNRNAHLPVISSFKTTFYFLPHVSEYTWIAIYDHTALIGTKNEMYKCTSLTKCRPPMVINAAIIWIFFWYTQIMMVFVTYSQRSEIKGVLLFYPVQYVHKSVLDLCMIWQKNAFITIEEGCVALLRSVLCTSPSKTCHLDLCIQKVESHWYVSQMMCSNTTG